MRIIHKTYTINAPVKNVWKALVNPGEIDNWGAGPAKMSDKENTQFELWGGDIHGINTEVVENKKLSQDWIAGEWKEPSELVIELEDRGDKTEIKLMHKGVPEDEHDEIESGWDEYYFGPMKEYLESN